MSIEISNHAAQRYAERIADRESLSDINIYVQRNMEKIEDDINKMLAHAEHIYSGRVGSKDKGVVNVYLSGTWILLLDSSNSKVITLYKVDFNVGEDFNKEFVRLILEKMSVHKQQLAEKQEKVAEDRNNYLEIIKSNDEQIAEYKLMIKNLEKLNDDYREMVADMNAEFAGIELAIRHDVETLMRKWQ